MLARLPNRAELLRIFCLCILPVQVWAIVQLLRETPSLLLRLSVGDLVGVAAYIEATSLLETLLLCLFVVILAALLPVSFFGQNKLTQAFFIVLSTTAWAVLGQFWRDAFFGWTSPQLLLWLLAYVLTITIPLYFFGKSYRAHRLIGEFSERVLPLSLLYLLLAMAGVIIVMVRNVAGAL